MIFARFDMVLIVRLSLQHSGACIAWYLQHFGAETSHVAFCNALEFELLTFWILFLNFKPFHMHGIVFFLSFLPLSSFLPVIWQVLANFWTQFSSLSFRHKVSSLPPSLLPFLPSLPPSFPHSFPSLFLRFFVRVFLPFLFLFLPSLLSVLLILVINDNKFFLILRITAFFWIRMPFIYSHRCEM